MDISTDIGRLNEVYIHDNGFKNGNYFSVKFAAKNDECIDMNLNPEELVMAAGSFLLAVIKAGLIKDVESICECQIVTKRKIHLRHKRTDKF